MQIEAKWEHGEDQGGGLGSIAGMEASFANAVISLTPCI